MDKQYLYNMYNATSTADENDPDEIETYENWLERQLISRIKRIEELEKECIHAPDRGIVLITSDEKDREKLQRLIDEKEIGFPPPKEVLEITLVPRPDGVEPYMYLKDERKTSKKRKRNHFTKRFQ